MGWVLRTAGVLAGAMVAASAPAAGAQNFDRGGGDGADSDQAFALHVQATGTLQFHPAFRSPYRGDQSLDPGARGNETADVTLYAGARPWKGAELWINPEIDQGFGLSNTLGVAGYPSGEAYKVGKRDPYLKLPRLFLRQTVDLGGGRDRTEADLNVLGGSHRADRLVLTVGKFGAPDIFDVNSYAHDPRQDFLNWSLIDTGSFDYAADAWGFTYGAAAEWYRGGWTLRAGLFDLSQVPNSTTLDAKFEQYQQIGEVERRYDWGGRKGKMALTGFLTHGRMGAYAPGRGLRTAGGRGRGAPLRDPLGGERERRAVADGQPGPVRAGRRGGRQGRGLRVRRHRPHRRGGTFARRRALGARERHGRGRHRGQPDFGRPSGLSGCGRGRHPGRRREAAASWR
jgi:hypothetical protein